MANFVIEWDDSLVLGIREIDEHHRHLVGLLAKSYQAITLDDPKAEVEAIVEELSSYSTYHFSVEERLMSDYRYPQLNSHLLEHAEFSRKVGEFREMCKGSESASAIELLVFLRGWLVNHILKVDRLYASFIIGNGAE